MFVCLFFIGTQFFSRFNNLCSMKRIVLGQVYSLNKWNMSAGATVWLTDVFLIIFG